MIDKTLIANIVNEYLNDRDLFLVGVKVSKNNVITVTIDGDNGVVVDNCIEVSKYIESRMDRDKEDFELTVTSFGLGEFFTMQRQYKKNIGENVEIVLNDNDKINGILTDIKDGKVFITRKKEKEPIIIDFNNISKTRVLINF